MKLIEYADSEILWLDLANTIAGELNRGLMGHDRVSLVVPGGTTPGPVFDVLSAISLPWERVDVLLTDERWVPEDNPRSHARLLREHLLVDKAAAARFIPFYTGGDASKIDLADVSTKVRSLSPFTLVLLGMGYDMRVASLFPGGDTLARALAPDAPEVLAINAPKAEVTRVTLSAEIINAAMSKHLVIVGDDKLDTLRQAEAEGDPMVAPVTAVMDNLTVHWAKS